MRKAMLTDCANRHGRNSLLPFTFGVIESILKDSPIPAEEKIADALSVIEEYDKVVNDDSLPWNK